MSMMGYKAEAERIIGEIGYQYRSIYKPVLEEGKTIETYILNDLTLGKTESSITLLIYVSVVMLVVTSALCLTMFLWLYRDYKMIKHLYKAPEIKKRGEKQLLSDFMMIGVLLLIMTLSYLIYTTLENNVSIKEQARKDVTELRTMVLKSIDLTKFEEVPYNVVSIKEHFDESYEIVLLVDDKEETYYLKKESIVEGINPLKKGTYRIYGNKRVIENHFLYTDLVGDKTYYTLKLQGTEE